MRNISLQSSNMKNKRPSFEYIRQMTREHEYFQHNINEKDQLLVKININV